ncbi:hypothetical protein [Absidia glauca]|uniref:PAS domain-containing protein n=1 Tax=Absidia glauca TaxID=4829 RepID=A0A163LTX5_ABSGL|nr:hypothetical protein [Absidia glauca]
MQATLDSPSCLFSSTSGSCLQNNATEKDPSQPPPQTMLLMNSYGIILAVQDQPRNLVGQPLMRFIHNDDIPILCAAALQHHDTFDLRCNFTSDSTDFDTLYHFDTHTITDTCDILCVMRPLQPRRRRALFGFIQQLLWAAAEQGVASLTQRLARYYPSFWLKASELALHCLLAETKSRHGDTLERWLAWFSLV